MPKAKEMLVDHPGEIIAEELEARGWAQADLAFILGVAPQQLNNLLTGKIGISSDMAAALGEAFDMPAEFFANLQKMYDLSQARKPDPGVRTRASWLSVFPVREMIKRRWIEETDPALLDLQMIRFFGKNRVEDIPFVGQGAIVPHAAKKQAYDQTTPVQYVWLHRVKKIAEFINCPPYSRQSLLDNLKKIRAHMMDVDDLSHIPNILHKCGVRYVLVEALQGSKIDGVCVWLGDQPVIGMTTRLDRLDNFCFVLRHEIEHVLHEHGKEETFSPVDEFEDDLENSSDLPEEKLANEAAGEFCVPREQLNSFLLRKGPFISEKDVLSFAARMEIHPAVIIGQIQNKTKRYAWLRKYQTGIRQYLFNGKFKDGWGFYAPSGL
jgi:HTH-type transcriptional regulator / antitoxin HigA